MLNEKIWLNETISPYEKNIYILLAVHDPHVSIHASHGCSH